MKAAACLLSLMLCCLLPAAAAEKPDGGQVQIPLDVYRMLLEQASDPTRPAPAGFALGSAAVNVQVDNVEPHPTGTVTATLGIDVLEDQWVLVPVLPPGTPVQTVIVDGRAVQLMPTPLGLAWSTRRAGSYTMQLTYRVDTVRSDEGFSLPLPLPAAAAIQLTATLPGTGLDAVVIPSAGTRMAVAGSNTRVTATVPTTSGVQISWRARGKRGHTVSRAAYRGKLVGDAVVWTAKLDVELLGEQSAVLPLLPRSVTLSDLRVDGKRATILVEGDRFATVINGVGRHEVELDFQTAVVAGEGPPRVGFEIPQIPVSRFELTLPGKKELTLQPAANVTTRTEGQTTVAVAHVPMTGQVSLSWSEAVPEAIRAEVRSNASVFHLVHAEENVLYTRALVQLEVNRGETNTVDLALPAGAQINRIDSPSGAVADWRITRPEKGDAEVRVFLDRKLKGTLLLDVFYDRSLRSGEAEGPKAIDVPLLRVVDAQRQKGMIALLSDKELTLVPLETGEATKVGENQLPAFVRESTERTVAHTFKYTETPPALVVEARVPEREPGKFDAQVDTLISLGDVTLTGNAAVELHVKSGRIMELLLGLPDGVSLLNLTAPSLRNFEVDDSVTPSVVRVEFTREMEGRFRVDLTYERILGEAEPRIAVPTVSVPDAEVEQGRIALEALSAAEIGPSVTEQLTPVDVNELPQQLVLRTTNPILLAYKYVQAEPRPHLAVEVRRHRVLGVQEAAIDQATYRTLFTTDGLLVTTAEFTVRNSRKQFLRVRLPEESEIWSAFVDGKPEKPALAENGDSAEPTEVLIKIINSTRPFTVNLVYATQGGSIRGLGNVEGSLPRPDILVTRSRWDVLLPEGLAYRDPTTNMNVMTRGTQVSRDAIDAELDRLEQATGARRAIEPLRILVPDTGVRYTFEKLYANQAEQEAWFRLPYASAAGEAAAIALRVGGTVMLWVGLGLFVRRKARVVATGLVAAGLVVLVVVVGVYGFGLGLPLVLSAVAAVALVVVELRRGAAFWPATRAANSGG